MRSLKKGKKGKKRFTVKKDRTKLVDLFKFNLKFSKIYYRTAIHLFGT